MPYRNYVAITGTILSLSRGTDCCSQIMTIRSSTGIVNFVLSPETTVVESRRLRVGMRVSAFYDASLPVPLIYPPQYRAQLVTLVGRDEQAIIQFFDNSLTASDQSLRLNLSRSTPVETLNGQSFPCNPRNQYLLVYFSATTRSIPPQTTPRRIIVLCV